MMTSQDASRLVPPPSISLQKTVYLPAQMEAVEAPQLALAGRSNVGKSSLINCLAGKKNLAKTSSTPGKTRSLNFYLVQPGDFYLVDLPGYGYARRSKAERETWAKLIHRFLRWNSHLAGLILVLDARLPPQVPDMDLAALAADLDLPVIPVLTKADKCTQRECSTTVKSWVDILGPETAPLPFSSKTRRGREQLWERIQGLIQAVARHS